MKTSALTSVGIASDGTVFDIVVTADDAYEPKNADAAAMNGINGGFGRINLKTGYWSVMTFSFVDPATGSPLVIDSIPITFYDFDGAANGGALESIWSADHDSYDLSDDTSLSVTTNDGGVMFEKVPGGAPPPRRTRGRGERAAGAAAGAGAASASASAAAKLR